MFVYVTHDRRPKSVYIAITQWPATTSIIITIMLIERVCSWAGEETTADCYTAPRGLVKNVVT